MQEKLQVLKTEVEGAQRAIEKMKQEKKAMK
jgi:hypothetical protein